jgi:hypothetical protein
MGIGHRIERSTMVINFSTDIEKGHLGQGVFQEFGAPPSPEKSESGPNPCQETRFGHY